MKNKLEIYALSICFVSIISLVISVSIAGYAFLKVTLPETTMSSYQYKTYHLIENPTEEERKEFVLEKKSVQKDGIQTILQCLIFIITALIAFIIHWKLASRLREERV